MRSLIDIQQLSVQEIDELIEKNGAFAELVARQRLDLGEK